MFTGIVQAVGKIESLELRAEGGRVRVSLDTALADSLPIGSSIAVNGCCLTVVERDAGAFVADLSGETLRRTSFPELKPGKLVNLERPLIAGAEFGGHMVQGHVDGMGRVQSLVPEGENWWLSVRVPDALHTCIVEKGSITIDGISLTVARWNSGVADIAIIPFTYANTNVRNMIAGDSVNLEGDIFAKYIERYINARRDPPSSSLTIEELTKQGF